MVKASVPLALLKMGHKEKILAAAILAVETIVWWVQWYI